MSLEDLNYYSDRRTQGPPKAPTIYVRDADGNYLEDDEGCFIEKELPTRWVVCPICEGEGKVVNPSIDAGGLTAEDFERDPGFREEYMRGTYDIPCNYCGGKRVAKGVDWDALSEQDANDYQAQLDQEEADRAEWLAEIRMGC